MKNIKIKKTGLFFAIFFAIFLNTLTFAGTGFGISPDTLVNTLDPAPSNVFVLINNGAISTLLPDVIITNLTYGASWVDAADNPAFSPCETNIYASSFGYVLPKVGTNIVYLRYRNVLDGAFVTNQWIDFVPEPVLFINCYLLFMICYCVCGRKKHTTIKVDFKRHFLSIEIGSKVVTET